MKKFILLFLFFSPFVFGFSVPEPVNVDCDAPSNFRLMSQTDAQISLAWDASLTANTYKIWYEREEDQYVSGYFYTSGTGYIFSNLPVGSYRVYLSSVCGSTTSYDIWYDVDQY